MVRWMIKHTPFLDRVIIRMDNVWGYGKADSRYKWWYDLEETNGVLKILNNKSPND
jgi:hypothetical protein